MKKNVYERKTKAKGSLVECTNRRIRGQGIILEIVDGGEIESKMSGYGLKPFEIAGLSSVENEKKIVLNVWMQYARYDVEKKRKYARVKWFKRPSEYERDESPHNEEYLPTSILRVCRVKNRG